jgi:HD superfamily phosphohydrolase
MRDYQNEGLTHDPLHGYIPFTSAAAAGEVCERQFIDHPWLQRLRQIHQLQTAWWVFPSAEHTRFQHVLGVMHVASRAVAALYESLAETCPDTPSRGYVECLLRLAGLLHDVGHGPFGHFFDDHFLARFGHTHETIGARIIRDELGDMVRAVRGNPNGRLAGGEQLAPDHVAFLITRPKGNAAQDAAPGPPRWLCFLRSLFCGLYTVDNMDFVLRDAYMSGYSSRAFDLDRLLHYSFFSASGLTIHARGVPALVRFLAARAELFRSLYFHRTVRAIDLTLAELFAESGDYIFPGDPMARLDEYRRFTEWSLLVDVARWADSDEPVKRQLGQRWRQLLGRNLPWRMACERTVFFDPLSSEQSSIFSRPEFFEQALRDCLPAPARKMSLRVDLARHVNRPGTKGPAAGQNFLFDPARDEIRPLSDSELFRQIPFSYRICRVYSRTHEHDALLAAALDALVGPSAVDDATNM